MIKFYEKLLKDDKINSPYSKFFDDLCYFWTNDPEVNLMFLKNRQNACNDMLKRDGYLFLNDVYQILGMKKTKIGQIVGWIYEENNKFGDNFVDFGIYDLEDEACRAFVNGTEPSILLNFNVNGEILSRIPDGLMKEF